jgi:predicted HD phosphohydrolase
LAIHSNRQRVEGSRAEAIAAAEESLKTAKKAEEAGRRKTMMVDVKMVNFGVCS